MEEKSRLTQRKLIYEHLKQFGSIEPMTALRDYGCYRLSSRISELRSEGIDIRTEYIMKRSKITGYFVKFAKYTAGVSENDKNLLSAIAFINETKQENVPTEERIEPTISEKEKQTIRMRISLKWAMGIMIVVIVALLVYLCWQLYDLRY